MGPLMYLKGGTRDHFMHFVAQQFPDMLSGYQRMYRGAYAPKGYVDTVKGLIAGLRERYDVARRELPPPAQAVPDRPGALALPEQSTFVWGTA